MDHHQPVDPAAMAEAERVLALAAQRTNAPGAGSALGALPSRATPKASPEVAQALVHLDDNGPETKATALTTISKILTNIVAKPREGKFRRLRLANAAIKAKVVDVPGGIELLAATGFVESEQAGDDGSVMVLPDATPLDRIEGALAAIKVALAKAGGKEEGWWWWQWWGWQWWWWWW